MRTGHYGIIDAPRGLEAGGPGAAWRQALWFEILKISNREYFRANFGLELLETLPEKTRRKACWPYSAKAPGSHRKRGQFRQGHDFTQIPVPARGPVGPAGLEIRAVRWTVIGALKLENLAKFGKRKYARN